MVSFAISLLVLLAVTNADFQADQYNFTSGGKALKGLYYFPALVGIDPQHPAGSTNLYGDYFKPLHERDLPLISELFPNPKEEGYIRLSGSASRDVTTDFLDTCSKNKLKVIMTFGFREYNIQKGADLRSVRSIIINDLKKWVDAHKSHPAVAMWSFGDLYDFVLGAGSKAGKEDVAQFASLLQALAKEIKNTDDKDDKNRKKHPIAISLFNPMVENALDDSFSQRIQEFQNHLGEDLDYFIVVNDLGGGSNIWKDTSKIDKALKIAGTATLDRPVIFQMAISAYSTGQAKMQDQQSELRQLLSGMRNLMSADSVPKKYLGLIINEWADQWWRGDTLDSCSSGLFQPYFQSRCFVGFTGLVAQRNSFGRHCITRRPAYFEFKNNDVSCLLAPCPNSTSKTPPELPDSCTILFPNFFWANSSSIFFIIPMAAVALVNFILGICWSVSKRKEKRQIEKFLNTMGRTSAKKETVLAKSGEKFVELSETKDEPRKVVTPPIAVPGYHAKFSLLSKKPPPTGPVGKFVLIDGTKAEGYNDGSKEDETLLELFFREHLRVQKINVDQMISHEASVVQTMVDFGLLVGLETKKQVYTYATDIVHTRMLEGYNCWLDKTQQTARQDRKPIDQYGEILLYRVMSSTSELIAHCPERLAFVFHEVLNTYAHETYSIDLDVLQDGLAQLNKDELNFDDINDCGILRQEKLQKTWFESPGALVVLDYMRDYNSIFFFKLYIFIAAQCTALIQNSTIEESNQIIDTLSGFCFAESIMFASCEFILFFYHWFYQMRKFPWDRLTGVIQCCVLCPVVLLSNNIVPPQTDSSQLNVGRLGLFIAYLLCRVLRCVTPHQWWKRCGKGRPVLYDTQMEGITKEQQQKDADIRENLQKETQFQAFIFWVGVFGLTFITERVMIVPIATTMTFQDMCYGVQEDALCYPSNVTGTYQIGDTHIVDVGLWGSNLCVCCHLSVTIAAALMYITIFIDTPLVFYIFVSIWGYYKGQTRKIQNVYANETCVVDLTVNGTERKNLEQIFGDWEQSACEVWISMINKLNDRDLICEDDRNKLATPGRKWNFALLNSEASQRLAFFLKTINSMAKAQRKNRQQQFAKEASNGSVHILDDAHRDKMGKVIQEQEGIDPSFGQSLRRISVAQMEEAEAKIDARRKNIKRVGRSFKFRANKGTYLERQKQAAFAQNRNSSRTSLISSFATGSFTDNPALDFLDEMKQEEEEVLESWDLAVPDTFDPEQKDEGFLGELEEELPGCSVDGALGLYELSPEEQYDFELRTVPRLSHVITCYSETVTLSRTYLQTRNGQLTNLEHMINLSEYKLEWAHLEERFLQRFDDIGPNTNLLLEFLNARPIPNPDSVVETFRSEYEAALVREVRMWASYRAQTISRTIRGALEYHESLLNRFDRFERVDGKPMNLKLNQFVELIVAHQTYGSYPGAGSAKADVDGWKSRRDDMEWILKKHENFPIYLVFDYGIPPPIKNRNPSGISGEDFDFYWKALCEFYWEKDEQEVFSFWKKRMAEYGMPESDGIPNFKHGTCAKKMKGGELQLHCFMPRFGPLRMGGHHKTQGKAANQVNALRLISGHCTQVSDANMDGWLGEGYKLPFITRTFIEGDITRRTVGERKNILYRIVGFREYIFTGPLGAVGQAMASAEFVFGTLFQRVLSDPLNVRMHYGHPDFFDSFWVINRGTLSKASPRLNLSEDVFAGYNTLLRGEKITHSDSLEWQKGRETVFTAASGFLLKITSGSVAIMRTRDMKYIQLNLTFTKKLSLFFGGLGSFVLHVLIDASIMLYVLFFSVSALATITLADIQAVGSSLGMEWLIGIGLVTSLGYLTEMMLEYGWGAGLVSVLSTILPSSLFYLHQNKHMANALLESVRTGDAAYVDTGRPNPFDHYTLRLMYQLYAESHYYPGVLVVLLYLFYVEFVGGAGGTLPMILVTATTMAWFFAPVIFCPQISNLRLFVTDLVQVFNFLFSTRDKLDNKKAGESMDKFWRSSDEKFHALDNLTTRVVWLMFNLIPFTIFCSVSFSMFIDYMALFSFLLVGHLLCTFMFFFSNYTNVVRGIWMVFPFIAMWLLSSFMPFPTPWTTEAFLGLALFLLGVRIAHWLLLIVFTIIIKLRFCCMNATSQKKTKLRYTKFVNNMFFFSMSYHIHLYFGIIIVCAQCVVQVVFMVILVVLDVVVRMYRSLQVHSAAFSGNLKGNVDLI